MTGMTAASFENSTRRPIEEIKDKEPEANQVVKEEPEQIKEVVQE